MLKEAKKRRRESGSPLKQLSSMLGLNDLLYEPETAEEYYRRGIKYDPDDYDKRMADFNMAIEIDPDYPHGYFGRSGLHYDRGQLDLAIQDISRAIELGLNHHAAIGNRGEFLLANHNFAEAVPDFEKSLAIKPDSIFGLAGLAVARFHLGFEDEARQEWLKLENEGKVYRDVEKVAKKLHWQENVTRLAKALTDTLD